MPRPEVRPSMLPVMSRKVSEPPEVRASTCPETLVSSMPPPEVRRSTLNCAGIFTATRNRLRAPRRPPVRSFQKEPLETFSERRSTREIVFPVCVRVASRSCRMRASSSRLSALTMRVYSTTTCEPVVPCTSTRLAPKSCRETTV